jgi:reactive intermediate/imine deaminase
LTLEIETLFTEVAKLLSSRVQPRDSSVVQKSVENERCWVPRQSIREKEMARVEGRTGQAPKPVAAYSQAVRIGTTVSIAGQGGFNPKTNELAGQDVGTQTVQAFKNIEAALAACGSTLNDVIRIDVFLSTLSDFTAMNEQYEKIFVAPYPTRTTVGVELPPGMKVEITALAVQS